MSQRRLLSTIGLILLLVLAGVVLFVTFRTQILALIGAGSEGDGGRGRPPPLVETAPVQRREVEVSIPAVGTLTAPEAVMITTEAAGRVEEIRFKEGTGVEKGDVLVVLERGPQEARVREAKAQVQKLRRQSAREVELREEDFVSVEALDQTAAALEEAKAALDIAVEALDDRSVEAPFAGVTGRRLVSPGALLAPGDPITRLTQVPMLDLLFEIPEKRIGDLQPGLGVDVATPAFPDETFDGEVTFVGTEVDTDTRTLPLEATLPNADGRLKPGMFVDVALIIASEETLTIPESALISRGPTEFVYRLALDEGAEETPGPAAEGEAQNAHRAEARDRAGADGMEASAKGRGTTVKRQTVETGRRRGGWVEILSGLQEGDLVVTAGHGVLRDGMRVRTAGASGPPSGEPGPPGPNGPPNPETSR